MGTAVGLNMKFTASTGGLQQGVANAGKSLSQLSSIISQSAQTFDAFSAGNAAAAAAQQRLATDTASLASALKTGQISAQQFEEQAAALATEANNLASAFSRGASITEQYKTTQEKQADEMARLQSLLDAGAISQETYNRAAYEASGAAAAAAEQAKAAKVAEAEAAKQAAAEAAAAAEVVKAAEQARAAVVAEGASVTARYATEQEKQTAEMNRLQGLLDAGAISQETYNRAMHEASGAADAEAESLESFAKSQERAAAIVRKSMTAEEQHAEQLDELTKLYEEGHLDANQFAKAQDRLAKEFSQTEKAGEDANGMLKRMAGSLRALVVIEVGRILVSAFSSVTSTVTQTISKITQMVDETAKLSRQTGIAVEQLQVFQLAAQMSGVDNLVEPIRKLGIEIGNAAQSGNIEKFERLGLNFDALSRMAPEDQFKTIAAAIAALPTPAERAAAAVAIFGEQGVKMLPLFESNLAAIEERMKRLGVVLSEDQTGAIEEMNDALTMIRATFEGIIGQVTANLAPVITAMAEDLLSFIEGYQGLGDGTGGTALADSITEALFDGAEYLAGIFDYVVAQLSDWGVSFSGTAETLAATFDIFGTAIAVMEASFYFVRSVFNTFLAEASKWAASFVGMFSSAAAEFLNNFSQEMSRRAEQDRQAAADAADRAAGDGAGAAPRGDGPAAGWVGEERQRWNNRNSPEAQAAREARRAEQEAKRQAAADAQKEAERQKKLEEAEKERIKKREELDKKLADAEFNLVAKEMQYALKNAEDLAAVNQKALEQSDIRSGGIAQVIAMATGREDPAVTEARKQLKELQALRASVQALGNVVEIAGAA